MAVVALSFMVSTAGFVAAASAQGAPSGQTSPPPRQDPAKTAGTSAQEVKIRAWSHDSFGRIVFEWTSKVGYAAKVEGGKLFVRFYKPLHGDLAPVLTQLPKYVTAAELDDDGKTAVFTLTRPFSYRTFLYDYAVVVDLSEFVGNEPPSSAEMDPALPAPETKAPAMARAVESPPPAEEPKAETKPARKVNFPARPSKKPKAPVLAEAKQLGVRVGLHAGFTRVVFDWTAPVDFKVRRRGTKATVSFDRQARINVAKVRKSLPSAVPGFKAAISATGLAVDMTLVEGSRLRHFRTGTKVVVDVLKPSSEVAKALKQAAPLQVKKKTTKKTVEKTTEKVSEKVAERTTSPAPKSAPAKVGKAAKSLRPRSLIAATVVPMTKTETSPETAAATPGDEKTAAATNGAADATGDSWEQSGDGPPRTLEGIMEKDLFSLRFDWPEGVAAAIYRRAGYLWLIFDHLESLRLTNIVEKSDHRLEEIIQVPDARATILRVQARSGINPSLRKDGNVWFVDLKPQALRPEVPFIISVEPEAESGARLFLPVSNAVDEMTIRDTVVGDKLFVVPVPDLGRGVNRTRSYAQFLLIGTVQGVVVEPYTDGLDVRVEADGVEIRSQDDLFISARPADFDEASLLASDFDMEDSDDFEPMLDMERWALGPSPWFYESRKIMLGEIAAASPAERSRLRLQLAQYYFANNMASDAATLLKVIGDEDPKMTEEADYKLFLGISLFMNGDYLESGKYLYSQGMGGLPEGVLWQAVLAADQGDWSDAIDGFSRAANLMQFYPANIGRKIGLLAAETAIASKNYEAAKSFLGIVKESDPSASELNYAAYLLGETFMATDATDSALAIWDKVIEGSDRRSRAKSIYAKVNYLFESGSLTQEEFIEELERLRFVWRGDEFEFVLLEHLGDLYIQNGDVHNSLVTLKQAATAFPRHEKARELRKKMGDIFVSLYLDGGADNLSPIKSLAIFNEFRELTPGGKRGGQMIRNLANRMVAVDLLDEAGELLDQLIKFRLQGVEKAEVGARLAFIQILDQTPQESLKTLTDSAEKNLPSRLVLRRRHLEARALVDLKRWPEALAIIQGDESLDAHKLRADIFWREQNWASAAAAISRVVEEIEHLSAAMAKPDSRSRDADRKAGEKPKSQEKEVSAAAETSAIEAEEEAVADAASAIMGEPEKVSPHLLMRWAVAMALSDNMAGLFYLRDKYSDFMGRSPYLDDFTVIVTEPTGSADSMKAIVDRLKEVSKYEAFMAGYRERLEEEDLSAIN